MTKMNSVNNSCCGPSWNDVESMLFLGGGVKYFIFSSLFGEMIQYDEHIFQMGGSTTSQEIPFLCQEVDEKPGQPLLQVGDCIQEAASAVCHDDGKLVFWGGNTWWWFLFG